MKMKNKVIAMIAILSVWITGMLPNVAYAYLDGIQKPTISVNGARYCVNVYGDCYKLRGLAAALNGTKKQFDIGWDATDNSLVITRGKSYQVSAGDFGILDRTMGSGQYQDFKLKIDGVTTIVQGVNKEGNAHISLSDSMRLLDIAFIRDNYNECFRIDTELNNVLTATKVSDGRSIYFVEDVEAGKVKSDDLVRGVNGLIYPYDRTSNRVDGSKYPAWGINNESRTNIMPIKAKAPGTLYQSDKNRRTAQEGDTFIDANGKKWTLHKDPVTGTFNPADPIGIDLGRTTCLGTVDYGCLSDGQDGGDIGDSYVKAPNGHMDWYINFLQIKRSGYDKPSKPGTKKWEMSPNKYYTWDAEISQWSFAVGK